MIFTHAIPHVDALLNIQFISKQDRKAKRRREQDAQRLDKLADVGDFGEFDEISELAAGRDGAELDQRQDAAANGSDAAAALQRAVNVFTQSSKRTKHTAKDVFATV